MKLVKSIIFIPALLIIGCSAPDAVSEITHQNTSSVKYGVIESGNFSERNNKTFKKGEAIVIQAEVSDLHIKEGQLKVNENVSLFQDNKLIDQKEDILGNGSVIKINTQENSSEKGATIISTTIYPPEKTRGELEAVISIKDLNSGKVTELKTGFTVQD